MWFWTLFCVLFYLAAINHSLSQILAKGYFFIILAYLWKVKKLKFTSRTKPLRCLNFAGIYSTLYRNHSELPFSFSSLIVRSFQKGVCLCCVGDAEKLKASFPFPGYAPMIWMESRHIFIPQTFVFFHFIFDSNLSAALHSRFWASSRPSFST